jgi:hypothetical protein
MRRALLLGLMLFAGVSPAAGQDVVVSGHADTLSVTIYHTGTSSTADLSQARAPIMRSYGLALISETRTVDLPAGPVVLQLRNVSSTMVPQTADVSGLPEKVDERNFDFNLLSPASLIQKSIGETVRLFRTNRSTNAPEEDTAILRSGPEGVMLQIGGRFEALKCSALPERMVFDHIPAGLYESPTLTVRTQVPRAGRYTITLRYLTTGLYWSANYVARIARNDLTLDLKGWITLANFSETSFKDVPVNVIAGQLERTGDDEPVTLPNIARSDLCWPTDINWASHYLAPPPYASPNPVGGRPGSEIVTVTGTSIRGSAPVGANLISIDPRNFGDYKLYPLPELTTVAAQQTKQVQFLNQDGVPFERIYRHYNQEMEPYDLEEFNAPETYMLLRLQNTKAGRLGRPLPAGEVAAFVTIGTEAPIPVTFEQGVRDTPTGLPLEIPAGMTTKDVVIRKRVVSSEAIRQEDRLRRTTLEATITNAKSKPITFEWAQYPYSDFKLISETRPHRIKNGYPTWTFTLAPGQRIIFQYTAEY